MILILDGSGRPFSSDTCSSFDRIRLAYSTSASKAATKFGSFRVGVVETRLPNHFIIPEFAGPCIKEKGVQPLSAYVRCHFKNLIMPVPIINKSDIFYLFIFIIF